jgi:hypothetical protein
MLPIGHNYDAATIDSTGAFLVGQLEKLDPQYNGPLSAVTWGRDIDVRGDVSIADESASFTNTTFAAAGGINSGGKNWIGNKTSAVNGIKADIAKTAQNLYNWGLELAYTIFELEKAVKLGQPLDSLLIEGLYLKWNMDIDEQVYIGDSVLGVYGMVNNANVGIEAAADKVGGGKAWVNADGSLNATPSEILADINLLLNAQAKESGYAVYAEELRLPPLQYGALTVPVTIGGNVSILEYVAKNCVSASKNGRPLNIQPLKWLPAAGANSTDRCFCYTKSPKYLRFPMVPLNRTPPQFRGIAQAVVYYGKLGVVEVRYPDTIRYMDGI